MWKFGILLAAAIAAAPLATTAQTTALPFGISVLVSATARTSDVVATFQVNAPLKARETASHSAVATQQARDVLAKLRSALGVDATISDLGYAMNFRTMELDESATITVAPGDYAAAVKAAASAGATPVGTEVTIVARDPEKLEGQAQAEATKLARSRAESIAAADGRHVGKLLNVTPSALDIGRDIAGAAMSGGLGQLGFAIDARLGQLGSTLVEAQASAGGLYTFALQP